MALYCGIDLHSTKSWVAQDVEVYLDDDVSALGITCLLEPVKVLTAQIRAVEKEALERGRLRDEFAPIALQETSDRLEASPSPCRTRENADRRRTSRPSLRTLMNTAGWVEARRHEGGPPRRLSE